MLSVTEGNDSYFIIPEGNDSYFIIPKYLPFLNVR
jgi:hypothetical protein